MATKRQRRKRRRRSEGAAASRTAGGGEQAAEPSGVAEDDAGRPTAARRRGPPGEPPQAPWGSFPLSELVVLIAIVFLIGGFFVEPPRGAVMIGAGLVLGSLAGLELSVREHFAGYRSHTLLLASAIGVAVIVASFVSAAVAPGVGLAAGVAASGISGWLLAAAFRRRSGGALFRIRGGA